MIELVELLAGDLFVLLLVSIFLKNLDFEYRLVIFIVALNDTTRLF